MKFISCEHNLVTEVQSVLYIILCFVQLNKKWYSWHCISVQYLYSNTAETFGYGKH